MTANIQPNSIQNTEAPIDSVGQFYDAVQDHIPLSASAAARLEIRKLLLEMRHRSERNAIIA